MSGDWFRGKVMLCLLIFVVCAEISVSARASQTTEAAASGDTSGVLHRLMTDPLLARPPLLFQGIALPGDTAPTPCPSRVNISSALSLTSAVDLALCSNPRLRNTWAQIKANAALVGQARAAYLPTLSVQLSELNSHTVYPNFPSADNTTQGHMTYASLNWLLFDFGGRAANLEAADDALQAAINSDDAEMQRLLGEVVRDYFNAIVAKARLKADIRAATLARKSEGSARRRLRHGVGDRGDLAQAQTASAKANLTLARDTGELAKAQAELVYALGLVPDTNLILPSLVVPARSKALAALAQWMIVAERSQPGIRAAREQWAAAQAKVRSARSGGLPTLSFVTTFDQNGYPNQGLQTTGSNVAAIGLMLNIPIFDGFLQHYKVDEARARAEAAQAQMQDTEHRILEQVVAAYGDAVAALDTLDASKTLLKSARVAVGAAQDRYDHGVGSMLELLSAQSDLADARQQRIQSLAQWDASRLELLAASGVLGHAALGFARGGE